MQTLLSFLAVNAILQATKKVSTNWHWFETVTCTPLRKGDYGLRTILSSLNDFNCNRNPVKFQEVHGLFEYTF